jgi:hypothetical protein
MTVIPAQMSDALGPQKLVFCARTVEGGQTYVAVLASTPKRTIQRELDSELVRQQTLGFEASSREAVAILYGM